MQTKSGTSTVLIALLILFTFPIWIGLIGGTFGIVMGVFGAVIGIIGAIFGAIFGGLGSIIGAVFGFTAWPFLSVKLIIIAAIVLSIIIVSRSRRI